MIDKLNVLNKLAELDSITLELGCGKNKKLQSAIGIDAIDYDSVDIVGDIFEVMKAFPDTSVNSINSSHFFEHIDNIEGLLDEAARVLKSNGMLEVIVPHFSNPYFYSDPTHRTSFGLYTFCYYANESIFSRKVPTYQHILQFDLISVDLVFKSIRPFYLRHLLKRFIGFIFNSNDYMKEFYEENLTYIFPCYEIRYRLIKK